MRQGRVVQIDRQSDVALIDAGYPPQGLRLVEAPASPGDEVWVFGYEYVEDAAVLRMSRGSIGQRFLDFFQIDAAVRPGFSGGPVTTRGGKVVGILSFGLGGNPSLAYLVPAHVLDGYLSGTAAVSAAPPPPPPRTPAPSPQPQVRAPVDLLDPDFWKAATPERVRQAVRSGADVNARDKLGSTPLHEAAAGNGNPEVIRILVELGADVNARTVAGWTPLHQAARYSKEPGVVLVLLELGADPRARTNRGLTAWDLIQENKALRNTPAYWKLNDLRW